MLYEVITELSTGAGEPVRLDVDVTGRYLFLVALADLTLSQGNASGNLGLTQLARIEYSLNGGRINTDFIDNSAGVDSSVITSYSIHYTKLYDTCHIE